MKLSVITPTREREPFLSGLHQLLNRQTYQDWEWLIYDTSFYPSSNFVGDKISYFHSEEPVSLGEVRNRLIESATGDVIVHFDDDDYYSPHYLESVANYMQVADLFNMHSWFSYDVKSKQLYYWSTENMCDTHFVLDSMTGMRVREIDFGENMKMQREKLRLKGEQYGFSFAYRREIAKRFPFGDFDVGEDREFYQRVRENGCRIHAIADQKGDVIHVLHHLNTSKSYPQYRIPQFLVKNLFPDFFSYIEAYPHEN